MSIQARKYDFENIENLNCSALEMAYKVHWLGPLIMDWDATPCFDFFSFPVILAAIALSFIQIHPSVLCIVIREFSALFGTHTHSKEKWQNNEQSIESQCRTQWNSDDQVELEVGLRN